MGPGISPQTALGPVASTPWLCIRGHRDTDKDSFLDQISDFSEFSAGLDPNLSFHLCPCRVQI